MIDTFKQEIIGAENSRLDLLKWKLILTAVLGGVGLGISSSTGSKEASGTPSVLSSHLVLALIPFVCLYVDLLCRHLQIRIMVISEFFQRKVTGNTDELACFHDYEAFCSDVRKVFSLEDWALNASTLFLSGCVILAALLLKLPFLDMSVLLIAGILGIIGTIVLERGFGQKMKILLNSKSHYVDDRSLG